MMDSINKAYKVVTGNPITTTLRVWVLRQLHSPKKTLRNVCALRQTNSIDIPHSVEKRI